MTTKQAAIGSGFGSQTTASEVLGSQRLDGVTAIVTGGYAGVGLETTRVLSAAGATVIVPARTLEKARAALTGLPRVEIEALELADPASIDAFAAKVNASGRPVQLLVNNAGIMATPLFRDARGFEGQLATNHIGHFQLTVRLWPALLKAKGARVVALSSRGHVRSGVDFEDPHFERREYDKWAAYGQSKTANILFAVALDRRGESQQVRAFAVHPGAILTELMRSMPEDEQQRVIANAQREPAGVKTIAQGAATTVWCATSPTLNGLGGVYCEDCEIAEVAAPDANERRGVRPWAVDPDFAERLWLTSERWAGVTL